RRAVPPADYRFVRYLCWYPSTTEETRGLSMSYLNAAAFGIFYVYLNTVELRSLGRPVSLQSQPSKVLKMLVEHAGDVVTREALQAAVWEADTHVDFERGLNFCIAQIRASLGDSSESPKFLRTLPKRGYQFIAPVARI